LFAIFIIIIIIISNRYYWRPLQERTRITIVQS